MRTLFRLVHRQPQPFAPARWHGQRTEPCISAGQAFAAAPILGLVGRSFVVRRFVTVIVEHIVAGDARLVGGVLLFDHRLQFTAGDDAITFGQCVVWGFFVTGLGDLDHFEFDAVSEEETEREKRLVHVQL
jgi:hypothetical protein